MSPTSLPQGAGTPAERVDGEHSPLARGAIVNEDTPTGRSQLLHFRDSRTPHEIQIALERQLMTLFTAVIDNGELRMHARADVIGAPYHFDLRFVAALETTNCYSLRIAASWADAHETHHEYFRKTSGSWIESWTRDLTPAAAPADQKGSPERYRALAEAALTAEAHLDTVAAIQAAILAGLRDGGRFSTSHKEGGTHIVWRIDRFIRTDYGDDPAHTSYQDDTAFLAMLRQFLHSEVSRHAGKTPLSEVAVWKLILRRLTSPA